MCESASAMDPGVGVRWVIVAVSQSPRAQIDRTVLFIRPESRVYGRITETLFESSVETQ